MAKSLSEQRAQDREREAARELDALVFAAQRVQPPSLDPLAARRMVRGALAASEESALRTRRRTRYAALCAAAVLLFCLGGYARSHLQEGTLIAVAAHGLPLRLSLKTGDTLVLAPASKLEVLSEKPNLRRVRLAQGSALFDVTRQNRSQRFEVQTPHAEVQVRGTVFSVQVSSERSVVRVHEGSVRVAQQILKAGDVWTSDNEPPTRAQSAEQSLAPDIRAALAARSPVVHETNAPHADPAPPAPAVPLPLPTAQPEAPSDKPQAPSDKPQARSDKPQAPAQVSELDHLHELLRLGQTKLVIALARSRADLDDAFALVLADALRADGQFDEALDRYEALAERTHGSLRTQAGFAAAQIALVTRKDATRALRDIEHFALDRDDSALSERASVLHVEALLRLEQRAEARVIAARYLTREPHTEASERMRQVLLLPARDPARVNDASAPLF